MQEKLFRFSSQCPLLVRRTSAALGSWLESVAASGMDIGEKDFSDWNPDMRRTHDIYLDRAWIMDRGPFQHRI